MADSVREILSQLEQTRQDLLDLSDEIWESIDRDDIGNEADDVNTHLREDRNAPDR